MPAPYEIIPDPTFVPRPADDYLGTPAAERFRLKWGGRLTTPAFDDEAQALGYAGALLTGRRRPEFAS